MSLGVAVYRLALQLIAPGVPRARRAEWLAEWSAELWYVWRDYTRAGDRWTVARFCLGAIEDVRCLRRLDHALTARRAVRMSGSAVGCAAWLTVGAMVCFALAQLLPGVRREVRAPMYRNVTNVVAISPFGSAEAIQPENRLVEVRSWKRQQQHLFREFAFYQPVVKAVHIAAHYAPELTVARSSANLLQLLGATVSFRPSGTAGDPEPDLVLSESTWRSRFGARQGIFGERVRVGLQTARLAGVVADEATPAPGRVDAWLLLPDKLAEELPDNARVFAFGSLTDPSAEGFGERWKMTVGAWTENAVDYDCVALSARVSEAWHIFAFTVLLALLALPATTSLPLGEYPARDVRLPWSTGLRRWGFLATKIAVLLPGIYFGSMDLAYAVAWQNPHTSQYIQLVVTFGATLFSLRWALRDQRQRCPVCLRKLTCPVKVGQPSRNFLSWSGTELMCSGGHGLLHVPELPTSWFGSPRWLHLDPSWSGLFADAA